MISYLSVMKVDSMNKEEIIININYFSTVIFILDINNLYNLDKDELLFTLKNEFISKEVLILFLEDNDIPYKSYYGFKKILNQTTDFIYKTGLYRRIATNKG